MMEKKLITFYRPTLDCTVEKRPFVNKCWNVLCALRISLKKISHESSAVISIHQVKKPWTQFSADKHNRNDFLQQGNATQFQTRHLQASLLANGLEHTFNVYQSGMLLGWMRMLTTALAGSAITQNTPTRRCPRTPTAAHKHRGTLPAVSLSIASNNVLIKSVISSPRGMKLDMMNVTH